MSSITEEEENSFEDSLKIPSAFYTLRQRAYANLAQKAKLAYENLNLQQKSVTERKNAEINALEQLWKRSDDLSDDTNNETCSRTRAQRIQAIKDKCKEARAKLYLEIGQVTANFKRERTQLIKDCSAQDKFIDEHTLRVRQNEGHTLNYFLHPSPHNFASRSQANSTDEAILSSSSNVFAPSTQANSTDGADLSSSIHTKTSALPSPVNGSSRAILLPSPHTSTQIAPEPQVSSTGRSSLSSFACPFTPHCQDNNIGRAKLYPSPYSFAPQSLANSIGGTTPVPQAIQVPEYHSNLTPGPFEIPDLIAKAPARPYSSGYLVKDMPDNLPDIINYENPDDYLKWFICFQKDCFKMGTLMKTGDEVRAWLKQQSYCTQYVYKDCTSTTEWGIKQIEGGQETQKIS